MPIIPSNQRAYYPSRSPFAIETNIHIDNIDNIINNALPSYRTVQIVDGNGYLSSAYCYNINGIFIKCASLLYGHDVLKLVIYPLLDRDLYNLYDMHNIILHVDSDDVLKFKLRKWVLTNSGAMYVDRIAESKNPEFELLDMAKEFIIEKAHS